MPGVLFDRELFVSRADEQPHSYQLWQASVVRGGNEPHRPRPLFGFGEYPDNKHLYSKQAFHKTYIILASSLIKTEGQ